MKSRILFATVLFMTACTHPSSKQTESCLPASQVAKVLTVLEKAADQNATVNHRPTTATVLQQKTCEKETYLRSGSRIVIFRKDPSQPQVLDSSLTNASKPIATADCLNAATALVAEINPILSEVLTENHRRNPNLFADTEVGPAKWLNCSDHYASREWYESVSTLVHEVNHDNRMNSCLFAPETKSFMCFELSPDLPKRSLAKLDSFPTKNPAQQEALGFVQRTYLTNIDEPPLMLFDELNAYRLTLLTMTSILEKKGTTSTFDGDTRQGVLLPLFLLYVDLYLERLKAKSPALYASNFGKDSKNRRQVALLLDQGEDAYEAWLSALKKVGKPEKEIEASLWRAHLSARKRIGL